MPYKKAAADILPLIERGGSYNKQTGLTGFKAGGAEAFINAATTTSGYLYSGETYTPTGYKKAGQQIVFQKAGCRPRVRGAQKAHYAAAQTVTISRSTYGVNYLMVRIVGGGGTGGQANGTAGASGGGGGATAVCCIKLPTTGSATIVIGGPGQDSRITCGGFTCTAGKGGNGARSSSGGSGGTVIVTGNGGDGYLIASANGGSGGSTNGGTGGNDGSGSSISFTDYAPEGGTVAWSASGGSHNDNGVYEGGGGGASTLGNGGATYANSNGQAGQGPGAGGGGGTGYWGQDRTGGAGIAGAATVWY